MHFDKGKITHFLNTMNDDENDDTMRTMTR